MLDDNGDVQAILDWEICTLGDPLADLGLLLVYWAEPEDADQALVGVAPTVVARVRPAVGAAWIATPQRTGLDVSKIAYYRAFGFWKLACILQGVYVRYASGAAAGDRSGDRPVRRPCGAARRTGPGRSGVVVTDHDPSSLYEFDPDWGQPVDAALSRPVLVVGLEGWVDAGMGASAAIASLLASSPITPVASFDTELLIDQRARRPIARLEDGVTTELTWPTIRLVAGKDRVGADIAVPDRAGARLPLADLHQRRGGTGQGPEGAHGGGPGGLSGAHTPHPTGAAGLHRPAPVGRAGRPGGHGARHARSAGRECRRPSRCRWAWPASR